MAETANEKRARELRAKIEQAKLERLQNTGSSANLFPAPPSKRKQEQEDRDVYNKLQNLREEEAEVMEQRAKGMKKGGVTRADGCITKGHTRGKMV
jgi:hypothetical protein